MDRRTEPPIWPSGESEIPEENEIPEGRRCSSGFFLCGGACARDGLAHAAGLALSVSHRLDCGSSACWINRQPGSSPASFGHQVLWLSIQTARLWAAESSKRSLAPRTMRMTWQEHYSPGHAANPTVSHNLSALHRGIRGCRGVRRLRALAALAKNSRRD